jgi:NAD(P)-dependent dehydrogenase (short-subunit alcohol dehydrogenase family)
LSEDIQAGRRAVLITGASRGIGRAVALRFAAEGYFVLANDLASQATALANLRENIVSAGGRCGIAPADVSDTDAVSEMIAMALREHRTIDVLVNNAGVISNRRIDDIDPHEWDRMFRVNTKGTFLVSKALLPHLRERRSGRIVNIASIGGKQGAIGQAHYAASKAAVINFTQVLAQEVGRDGITVNAVCPGIVDTEMWQLWLRDHPPEEAERLINERTTLGRLGRPEDVAGVVHFLASDDAAFITGQAINVCGGIIFH